VAAVHHHVRQNARGAASPRAKHKRQTAKAVSANLLPFRIYGPCACLSTPDPSARSALRVLL
jgi:hypothetical protein